MQKIETLILASHNKGKLKEIEALLKPFNVKIISAIDFGLEEPEETEDTFIGNALLKARAAAAASGFVSLADDSGLEVHALNGAPGIYSARWAIDPNTGVRDFGYAMKRIEKELEKNQAKDFSARFICVLALVWPNGEEKYFEGIVDGTLKFPPNGDRGFGYDPIFVANGETQTFGQMDPDTKHAMSHRANAFAKLIAEIFGTKE